MKRCFAALALICALALSGVAKAEGTGMYLAPKFLMSIQNNYPTVEIGPNDVSEGYSQFTLGGALALGYDFNSQFGVPVRAEVEYALRGNSEKKLELRQDSGSQGRLERFHAVPEPLL
ncbi:hypothetical protein [Desulfovibrio sp.]|uniref:hypothetical protein n=1 Tax=Desulfovibrio sp. TaxID=885 RepID=UPI003AAB1446